MARKKKKAQGLPFFYRGARVLIRTGIKGTFLEFGKQGGIAKVINERGMIEHIPARKIERLNRDALQDHDGPITE